MSTTSSARALPPFMAKLYEMTHETHGQDDCFKWSDDGLSFWVSNAEQFARDVLPAFFKHNNYASFVRQLNLYGFRRSTEHKGRITPGVAMVEVFRHPYFVRGRRDLLHLIQRKAVVPAARRIKPDPDSNANDDSSISFDTLSQASPTGAHQQVSLLASHLQADSEIRAEVQELQAHTVRLEQEVVSLRSQNAILASQQEQQGAVLQSLVDLLARCGVNVDDLAMVNNGAAMVPHAPAQVSAPTSMLTSHASVRRADTFRRSDSFQGRRALPAAHASAATMDDSSMFVDDDDDVVFDMDFLDDGYQFQPELVSMA